MSFLADLLLEVSGQTKMAFQCMLTGQDIKSVLSTNGTEVAEDQSQKGKSTFKLRFERELAQRYRVGSYVLARGKRYVKIVLVACQGNWRVRR